MTTIIEDIHPEDAYHEDKDDLLGLQVMPAHMLPPDEEGWQAGHVTITDDNAIVLFQDRTLFFYAVKLGEKE